MNDKEEDLSNGDEMNGKLQQVKAKNEELKMRLQCQKEITDGLENLKSREEQRLNDKLQTLWSNTEKFLEEAETFHDRFGFFSTWWNDQIFALQNSNSQSTVIARKQKERALVLAQEEQKNLSDYVTSQHNEMMNLKSKITSDDAKIVQLQKVQETLQQEQFGAEFLNLKYQLQKSKETCEQLEKAVVAQELNFRRGTSGDNLLGAAQLLPYQMPQKVFRIKEKTTFTLKTPYNDNKGKTMQKLPSNLQRQEPGLFKLLTKRKQQ